jgi:hypothetical protein
MSRSQNNNRIYPLGASGTANSIFTGLPEATLDCVAISVSIVVPTQCLLTIQQSYDKVNWYVTESFTVPVGEHRQYQQAASLEYFRVILTNQGVLQTYCHMISTRSQSLTQNVNIRNLTLARDSVNASVSGQNSPYAFYPTAANNLPAIYADETKGTDVVGGWQYTNQITGKINWYCYGSAGSATDYKVSQLNSMYTVINQQTTLGLAQGQNPFIIFYTRPTGDGDALWYKSKYFFGSNAHTDISGTKLLYTGEDPTTIHPEITGIDRIQLLFVPEESTKTVAQGADESIWLGSLQTTDNTSPAGSFNFTMLEYGAVWDTVDSVLPIEFGRVQCDVLGTVGLTPSITTATYNQAVAAVSFTGTAFDMGENSLVDILLLANATGAANGNVRLDYSTDGLTWFPDNTNLYPITTTDLHYVISGKKTASRYIRVSTGGGSAFRTSNLTMTFTSKRN